MLSRGGFLIPPTNFKEEKRRLTLFKEARNLNDIELEVLDAPATVARSWDELTEGDLKEMRDQQVAFFGRVLSLDGEPVPGVGVRSCPCQAVLSRALVSKVKTILARTKSFSQFITAP